MLKSVLFSLAACAVLTGCAVFKKSRTWDTVVRTRPDVSSAPDPSSAHAEHLHRVLARDGVAHKVVSYEFRYTTRFREEAVSARTAILYRDDTHPTHPWWGTDSRTARPVWLPNGPVEEQLRFFARGHADVVKLREFPGAHGGKNIVATFRTQRFASLRSVALAPESDAVEPRWEEVFRARHGTAFDPGSALDRRKMSVLRRAF